MGWLWAVWSWLSRPRVAEGCVYEVHLYVLASGRVELYGAKSGSPRQLAAVYPALIGRLCREAGALGLTLDVTVGGQQIPLVRPPVLVVPGEPA